MTFLLFWTLTQKKSNECYFREYDNNNKKIYGKLYELKGDVASPSILSYRQSFKFYKRFG